MLLGLVGAGLFVVWKIAINAIPKLATFPMPIIAFVLMLIIVSIPVILLREK